MVESVGAAGRLQDNMGGFRVNKRKMFRAVVAALALNGAGAAVAAPAMAGGDGNTVNNCFGRWYNTDWDQMCGGTGATQAGHYRSTAACTAQTDVQRTWVRAVGSTTTHDGQDCRYSVAGVVTSFF